MNRWIMLAAVALLVTGCWNRNWKKQESPTRGTAAVLVDETVYPTIEGVARVFKSQYRRAHLDVMPHPEQDISVLLRSDSLRLAVLSRPLNDEESAWFSERNINTRVTEIAFDGIALITSRESRDTVVTTSDLREMLTGRMENGPILVFDNPNSGLIRYVKQLVQADSLSGVFALNSTAEVLEYISRTPDAIGFIGVSWLYDADPLNRSYIDRIRLVGVGDEVSGFYRPTQSDIAEGKYPFTRKIYFINGQGSVGLGMGFASFLAGDIGQRIILQSGLVPITFPKREIIIRQHL